MPNFLAAVALLTSSALLVSGCAGPGQEDDEFVVLTTFTVIADMAKNVAGEHARVESLTKPGAEIHGYEPTPSDIVRGLEADLILDNGLGLEAWFADFVQDVNAPHVTLSESLTPIPIEGREGVPNPHAWMSPREAVHYVEAIRAALTEADPAHADAYAFNAARYTEEIESIGSTLVEDLAEVSEDRRVLVTCEGAWSYLARDASLEEVYLWATNSDGAATPQSVAHAIHVVTQAQVPSVFCESTVGPEAMYAVAAESGAEFGGILFVDSLTEEDGPAPTYLALLEHNVRTIVAGLTVSDEGVSPHDAPGVDPDA